MQAFYCCDSAVFLVLLQCGGFSRQPVERCFSGCYVGLDGFEVTSLVSYSWGVWFFIIPLINKFDWRRNIYLQIFSSLRRICLIDGYQSISLCNYLFASHVRGVNGFYASYRICCPLALASRGLNTVWMNEIWYPRYLICHNLWIIHFIFTIHSMFMCVDCGESLHIFNSSKTQFSG